MYVTLTCKHVRGWLAALEGPNGEARRRAASEMRILISMSEADFSAKVEKLAANLVASYNTHLKAADEPLREPRHFIETARIVLAMRRSSIPE